MPKAKALKPVTVKLRNYLKGVRMGKTKRLAAREAGYSPNTPTSTIEASNQFKSFRKRLNKAIPDKRIVQTIDEGLKANAVSTFEGEVVSEHPDHLARHKFLETTLKLKGFAREAAEEEQQPLGITVTIKPAEKGR